MFPLEGKAKLNRGSPRKRAKGAGGKGLEAGLRGAEGKQTGQASPKKSLRSSRGFSDRRGFGLLRGGGAQSGQVCIVIVKMPPGKAGQRAIPPPPTPAENLSPCPTQPHYSKENQNGFLPPCQDAKGPPSVLTLRKAKCAPSRPHA